MLVEALATLAAAAGGAVAQAAGTDAWQAVRRRVAELSGRGDAELERLDRTSRALEPGTTADQESERVRQAGMWQARFETLLESLDPEDQQRAADELRALLAFVTGSDGDVAAATGRAVARDGGTAVTGVERAGGVGRGRGSGGRSARAFNTGDAEATGQGSRAVSGVADA
ncbi:hypothetical protein [Streptomyces sp. NBC_00503]|uniref:hypothetical protein n=1 Tax=Streptomyces sp. NBC_00503 TaxID=2903659 RepID=UPI002E81269A|nr:hypothetical protein [Streptomyces sp. NBC_00503]WUD85376.1 hypothetical protein OG490_35095 [Streptomyces sp. NBC_00503]